MSSLNEFLKFFFFNLLLLNPFLRILLNLLLLLLNLLLLLRG